MAGDGGREKLFAARLLGRGHSELHCWQEPVHIARFTSMGFPGSLVRSCYTHGCLGISLNLSCSRRQCQSRFTAQSQHSTGKKAKPYMFPPVD